MDESINPISDELFLHEGGDEDVPKRRIDAMEMALAKAEVAPPSRGLPERALTGDDMGWNCPREGRCRGWINFGSSGTGVAGNAKGGVVEKKSVFAGGDCVEAE